jgi:hypothetical protein
MGAPSSTATRNGDDRDATSKPSDACADAVVVDPSPGQAPSPEWVPSLEWAPNRERPPNRERARVPTAIRNGDDRDPTSKPSGACAVAADPSPGQVPNREQAPNPEHAVVPTTALQSGDQTVCRPVQVEGRPASLPPPQ